MYQNYDHPTADELYDLARQQEPRISRGTIYRNLNILIEGGALRRLPMPAGPDHYDCVLTDHYHFFCRSCGKVMDTQLPYNEALNTVPPGPPGCKTEWHRLVLVGLCQNCNPSIEKA